MTDATATPTRAQRWLTTLDGHQLRQLRRQAGLSQANLAGRAGLSLTTIVRLEHAPQTSCRPRTLARLAAALGEPHTHLTPGPPAEEGASQEPRRPS